MEKYILNPEQIKFNLPPYIEVVFKDIKTLERIEKSGRLMRLLLKTKTIKNKFELCN